MSTWDKADREVWNKSEVMQELEKKIAHTALDLQSKLDKFAGIKEVTDNVKDLGTHAPPAAKAVTEVASAVEQLEGSAEDEVVEEEIEELEEVAADLIQELTKLSYILADEGDVSLAYKVERVIQDIQSGFSNDED